MALDGGTGSKLGHVAIIVAGACSLIATLLAFVSIWLQLKNYRKPLLQRYVVRILLMVPIYALSSWVSLMSINAAMYVDPIRDNYEAFTIYTFFQLLINYLGGERALIIMTHGRAPKEHLWPLNYILPKVDISDPHTFLAIKRGILQYAWMKPLLALAAVIMKATGTYQEGYVGLNSGYFWSGIIYNISVTVSLYSLGMFWVCMSRDLQPFRPVPKFLCVKLIIFASYWQGFFLSILVWLGVIRDVGHYTPDNLAAAIQDALICFELPGFAIAHWNAFSWKDYADSTISAARMPVIYALRDAFGIRDLIEDSKITFKGKGYDYRLFDPAESILEHPESAARVNKMMEGLRYHKGGKSKYWIPKPTAATGLLSAPGPSSSPRPMSPSVAERISDRTWYGGNPTGLEQLVIDDEDERMYEDARKMEYGDYNYPVITAYEPLRNVRAGSCSGYQVGGLITATNYEAMLQKTTKGKSREEQKRPLLKRNTSSGSSNLADRPENGDANRERGDLERIRKGNTLGWSSIEPKRRDYSETEARKIVRQEDFRESDISPVAQTSLASSEGQSSSPGGFTSEDDGTHNVNVLHDCTNVERPWGTSTSKRPESVRDVSYDGLDEERNPWT